MKLLTSLLCVAVLPAICSALIPVEELRENAAQGLRLISLEEGVDPVWKTEVQVLGLIKAGKKFFDVTEIYDPADVPVSRFATESAVASSDTPIGIQSAQIQALIAQVSVSNLQAYLGNLTAYNNRYYKATTGANAATWVRTTLQSIATAYPASGATVSAYVHSSFVQNSVIATIPGTDLTLPRVILGAHLDSINGNSPTSGRAPGADDNGSGTVNQMEAFRILVTNGFKGRATIEFHFYAGEEGGLLGSGAIAKAYKTAGTPVKGMLNLDMTAYVKPGTTEVVGLMPDYTQSALTTTVKNLITTYLSIPWVTSTACGYACSDHASWHNQGFPAAMALEATKNNISPVLHTSSDTTTQTGFSWTHMAEFSKLSIAFAAELSA